MRPQGAKFNDYLLAVQRVADLRNDKSLRRSLNRAEADGAGRVAKSVLDSPGVAAPVCSPRGDLLTVQAARYPGAGRTEGGRASTGLAHFERAYADPCMTNIARLTTPASKAKGRNRSRNPLVKMCRSISSK